MYVNEVLFNEFRNGRSFVDLAAFFSKDFRFNDYSRTFSRSGKLYVLFWIVSYRLVIFLIIYFIFDEFC